MIAMLRPRPRTFLRDVGRVDLAAEREADLRALHDIRHRVRASVDDDLRDVMAHRDDGDDVLAGAERRAVALDLELARLAADGDGLLAHFENREPGASSGTPLPHNGHAASSYVSSASDISAAYCASNGFSFPLRL